MNPTVNEKQISASMQVQEKKEWTKPWLSDEIGILETRANNGGSKNNDGSGWAS